MGGRGKKQKIDPGSERKIGLGIEPDGEREPEPESEIGEELARR